jgi:hypothetical protein
MGSRRSIGAYFRGKNPIGAVRTGTGEVMRLTSSPLKGGDFRYRGRRSAPAISIFRASLMSRSCNVAHSSHRHCLTPSAPNPFGLLAGCTHKPSTFGNCSARERRPSHRLSLSTCTIACCRVSTSRRRARTSPSVSWPASSGSRLRCRSPRNAARDRATSRGGNADACWRFSLPAALREPSARAAETLRVISPLAGRILALRSSIRWTEQRRSSGRDRCRGRARCAVRAALVRAMLAWMLTCQRPRAAVENCHDSACRSPV